MKFGGSSLADAKCIKQVASIVGDALNLNRDALIIVVSAIGHTTDYLESMAEKASQNNLSFCGDFDACKKRHQQVITELNINASDEFFSAVCLPIFTKLKALLDQINAQQAVSAKQLDEVLSCGERLSANILSKYLSNKRPHTLYVDTRQLITTNDNYGNARVIQDKTREKIHNFFTEKLKKNLVAVATGFISATETGETTTLGRGGSDYTASLLAAALKANEIEIWSDVDGVLSADPHKVKRAFSIPSMTYDEAMEICHFGARVIYPPTMAPALRADIPIRLRNTFNPTFKGTYISALELPYHFPIKGISSIDKVSLLRFEGTGIIGIPGIASRLFGALAKQNINVILISQASSEHTICFAVAPQDAEKAKIAVEADFADEISRQTFKPLVIEHDLSILAVVGENMRHTPGIGGKLFQALGKNGINVIATAQGSSELNISFVVNRKDETKALNIIHDAFFLSSAKTQYVFLAGLGQVGQKFVAQMADHQETLKRERSLEIRLIGVANSQKMLFNSDGIELHHCKQQLDNSAEVMQIDKFIHRMRQLNLPNAIFVDCTASEVIAQAYPAILRSSVNIVAANKIANSQSIGQYKRLKRITKELDLCYFYEPTVGAGLPVISTLHNLRSSGDRIVRIDAVLSGTLNYLFSNFKKGHSFSELVSKAQQQGYTEPDPRDDLSGQDVARKLLILAREAGFELSENDVEVESLVPKALDTNASVDEFFTALKQSDGNFSKRLATAITNNCKLCYISSVSKDSARGCLQEIDAKHPFYNLSGTDNIFAFVTSRYSEQPLIIRGPGAGTAVTAAGIFAEVLMTASYS